MKEQNKQNKLIRRYLYTEGSETTYEKSPGVMTNTRQVSKTTSLYNCIMSVARRRRYIMECNGYETNERTTN